MYVIVVYDISEDRVVRILKICRKYLNWVQNSVFEGEITKANFIKLKAELEKNMNKEEDSIIIYGLRTTLYSFRETIGKEKGGEEIII
ncbi:MAG: CRISPR-associated endonuclease Cas2 [Candidatus Atribacteria bacterium]|nr:CRISPR-associated endonuclease Cas2 [Candidatus Atribacteria bacterium]